MGSYTPEMVRMGVMHFHGNNGLFSPDSWDRGQRKCFERKNMMVSDKDS